MFSNPIVMVGLASVAAYAIGKLMVKGDGAVEERRRGAMTLVVDAEKAGLSFLTPILQDYAVGDYSGVLKEVSKLRDGLHDPEKRKLALATFLEKQFELYAADTEGAKKIMALVEKHIPDVEIAALAEKVKAQKVEVANVPGTPS